MPDRSLAELLHFDDPRPGASARAWLRDGHVVLLDVAWRSGAPLDALAGLGEPEERRDMVDGLVPLEGGEWLFPRRGLVDVVDAENRPPRTSLPEEA